ncbi:MAG: ornithine carbamoyltransferase [Candidatus Micrarchaeia archaeon]
MHMLGVDSLSKDDINELFEMADDIKNGKAEISIKEGYVLALLSQDHSISTRLAFEAAMARLGGRCSYLSVDEYGKGIDEDSANVARLLGSYADMIAARIPSHDSLLTIANSSAVPVINAGTDIEDPLSALAGLYTLKDKKGSLKGLKLSIIGNIELGSVNSLMLAATKLGAKVSIASPKEFVPNPSYLVKAREYGIVDLFYELTEGTADADALCIDYSSAGLNSEKQDALAAFILDKDELAKHDFVVMCSMSNANIESAASLLNDPKSIAWEQAKNMLYIIEAAILTISEKSA